jgi:hypothetical protein
VRPSPTRQEWARRYLLCKARRLRDATATLSLQQASTTSPTAATSSQAPAYLAARVEEGGSALPEVQVRKQELWRAQRRGTLEIGALDMEAQVVRHLVEGIRGELARELMEVWGL